MSQNSVLVEDQAYRRRGFILINSPLSTPLTHLEIK